MLSEKKIEKIQDNMPDLAAREPAEGNLDFPGKESHLCCPEMELSSELPVESGAMEEKETKLG